MKISICYSGRENKIPNYTRGAKLAETDKSLDPLNLIWVIPAEGSVRTFYVVYLTGLSPPPILRRRFFAFKKGVIA